MRVHRTSIRCLLALSGLVCSITGNAEEVFERDGAVLEEIVVTAQKREQAFLDVPVSVATVSGEVLDIVNADNFQDLVQVTPSLTHTQSNGQRGDGILIRGVGTTVFQSGVEPTISTVVDGVVLGRTGSFLSDLVDIERVEILRGPQGTLFGKNASGGVVNIVTARPTDEFGAMVRFSATDDDQTIVEAMVSGPLSDSVRGRLTAYWKDYEGYIDNEFNGDTLNGDDSIGFRGKLDIDLSDRANLLLIADYNDQERNCCVFAPRQVGSIPQFEPLLAFDLRSLDLDDDNNEVLLGTDVLSDQSLGGLSAELNIDFDTFTFTSITAWRFWEFETEQDVDSMPFTEASYARFLITSNGGDSETRQFSQEFRVNATIGENIDVTAGVFLWHQTLERYFQRELIICGAPAFDPALNPDPAVTPCVFPVTQFGFFNSDVDTENAALFGQVDWALSDSLTASFGLRYTYDDLEFDFSRPTGPIAFPAVPPLEADGGDSDTDLSGKAALQWAISDEFSTYISYTQGYKSQGFDIIFGLTPDRLDPIAPESSDAIEIGFKAELFDRKLRIGGAAFHTTFDDFQGQAFTDTRFELTSAGTVITRGIELDLTAKPFANLLINAGVAWTDAFYDDFEGGPCFTGQTAAQGCISGVQDVTDEDVPNSPDLKFTLQARYDIPLDGPFDLYVSGAYRWQDDAEGAINQRPELQIDSYGIVDLTVGLTTKDERWSASVFAKNLFDESYTNIVIETPLDGVSGFSHFLSRDFQRYIGAKIEYRIGS